MGGRDPVVKEVLMRHCGHGLLSTTKMALEVVGWGRGHRTLIWETLDSILFASRFLQIHRLNFPWFEERINTYADFSLAYFIPLASGLPPDMVHRGDVFQDTSPHAGEEQPLPRCPWDELRLAYIKDALCAASWTQLFINLLLTSTLHLSQ